jgi:hypothetical protein
MSARSAATSTLKVRAHHDEHCDERPKPVVVSDFVNPWMSSKFLHALAGIHLGSKDISLSVDSDVVQRRKLANLAARPAEATERFSSRRGQGCAPRHSSRRSCR